MKVPSEIQVLCIGGEMPIADLRRLLTVKNLVTTTVSWDEAPATLAQSCFDLIVMETADVSLDKEREQIMASLPTRTAVVLVPRLADRKSSAPVAATSKLQIA